MKKIYDLFSKIKEDHVLKEKIENAKNVNEVFDVFKKIDPTLNLGKFTRIISISYKEHFNKEKGPVKVKNSFFNSKLGRKVAALVLGGMAGMTAITSGSISSNVKATQNSYQAVQAYVDEYNTTGIPTGIFGSELFVSYRTRGEHVQNALDMITRLSSDIADLCTILPQEKRKIYDDETSDAKMKSDSISSSKGSDYEKWSKLDALVHKLTLSYTRAQGDVGRFQFENENKKEREEKEKRDKELQSLNVHSNIFESEKLDVSRKLKGVQNQFNDFVNKLSDKSVGMYKKSIDAYNKNFNDISEELNKAEFSKFDKVEFLSLDDNQYSNNVKFHFEDIRTSINNHEKNVTKLIEELRKTQQGIDKMVIEQAKDDYLNKISDLEIQIKDSFRPEESTDETLVENVKKMRNNLESRLEETRKLVNNMKNIDEKQEADIKVQLLQNNFDDSLARKLKLLEPILKKQANERRLQVGQDLERQIVELRNGNLTLDQVIAGYFGVKEQLFQLIDNNKKAFDSPEVFKASKGMIIAGPPGTGKTTMVRALAASRGIEVFVLKIPAGMRGAKEIIFKTFSDAKQRVKDTGANVIILVDEIEAIAPKRADENSAQNTDTVALMTAVDDLPNGSGVIIVGTTNVYNGIDSAFTRSGRIGEKVNMGIPTDLERIKIIELCLDGFKLEETTNLSQLASDLLPYTINMTGADLRSAIQTKVAEIQIDQKIGSLSDVRITKQQLIDIFKSYKK